jgi:transcription-repair coupling factor (superfamily II helicase)
MSLIGVRQALRGDQSISDALDLHVSRAVSGERDIVSVAGIRPFLVAEVAERQPVLLVTATEREADEARDAIASVIGASSVEYFPAWETLPHERLSPRSETVGQRLHVLRRLAHPTEQPLRVVVTPIRALLQPIVAGLGLVPPVRLAVGQEISLDDAIRSLVESAYTRTDLVEKRGEFAVRGGILDLFPVTENHPLRLEFWGDSIEEIRWFGVADQRSTDVGPNEVIAPACRELLLNEEMRERARSLISELPVVADMLEKIAQGIFVEGMESLAPVLVESFEMLIDLLPQESVIIVQDPERVRTRSADLVATSDEFLAASWFNAAAGNQTPVDLGRSSYRELDNVRSQAVLAGRTWWNFTPFGTDLGEGAVALNAEEVMHYRGETEQALVDLRTWLTDGWRCVVVTEGHGPAERMVEVLGAEGIPARLHERGEEDSLDRIDEGIVHVMTAVLQTGFLYPPQKIALLTEMDLSGQRSSTREMRRMPSKRRNVVDPLQLKPGDYVVHEQHGVGRYVELVNRTIAGATREYVVIEYAPSKRGQPADRLFVPTDSLDQVTRYVGGEQPSVHRMGGAEWAKAKGRARKAVREIAGELIRLYAARTSAPGFAFSPDTPWQRELEDAFPYMETPDQLATIDEVKADMEKPHPMDRIICGDVGYGKTEIAIRAAFKAVQDGKQVAVLVPTTLLVQQHMATFSERYAGFPVKVAALSRFQTAKESANVLIGLADGSIDVVIGTHRLLSAEVRFKDLGLVVVDEEQRFGVEHKEFLKQMRTSVDVLSMSATPIPRTLEMSITGIREMSTIATPPEERHPILTYVGAYDERHITAAIRRELLRDGQVFYVHNRVESIDRAAAHLRELVPEARIAVAHGQMNEEVLENIIVGFWEGEFDVLVCTTIIESGIDISNANTLIVERSDNFGLSQLHQLRGRVGRGRERAFAYFLYPADKPLTETAHERLATIAANTSLGSGMHVAMKDLEIRGAGNLLGGEQSGNIADVGFDLYIRMVGEAVAEYRGQPIHDSDCKVELPIDAHIPHGYIPGERLRLEAYRKMADVSSEADLVALREELSDRFGVLPEPVENLMLVAAFRARARSIGLREVSVQGSQIRLAPVELPESVELRIKRLYPGSLLKREVRTILIPRPTTARIGGEPLRDGPLLVWTQAVLDALAPTPVGSG